ncbi:unnamed protein product [Pieris macdunnoughi]|uniref:Uncharacterized protein n=1 Tax=Pieris macdunnoughi TaxID=345717 RepID=A0A821VHY3_9NEOP|nr:unnamed protein product [Pieris macdunnoughi]
MFRNILVISLFGYAFGQDFYEERHKYQYRAQIPLNKIPKNFEVKGDNAVAEFSKYLATIQDIAKRDNLTVIYKVKVDINSPKKQHNKKKKSLKKKSSKKYNVPLKKQSMKLSNFEMVLRKRIGEMGQQQQRAESDPTTQKQKILLTTKSPSAGKYKPIIRSVRTNYAKIVRPVRNKEITLTR